VKQLAFKTGKFSEFNLRRQFEFQILLILQILSAILSRFVPKGQLEISQTRQCLAKANN